ncbi:hypothetical protein B296_00051402 [Ensete ventricosum]|uniref:Uncharacterized protein n=1 Tax=Ensete ventricosum TaxID=4639 RepID=A0A426X7J2_ENSVE|nr:hypothetical protein B296_00051402 [Ensete ventricosum]
MEPPKPWKQQLHCKGKLLLACGDLTFKVVEASSGESESESDSERVSWKSSLCVVVGRDSRDSWVDLWPAGFQSLSLSVLRPRFNFTLSFWFLRVQDSCLYSVIVVECPAFVLRVQSTVAKLHLSWVKHPRDAKASVDASRKIFFPESTHVFNEATPKRLATPRWLPHFVI